MALEYWSTEETIPENVASELRRPHLPKEGKDKLFKDLVDPLNVLLKSVIEIHQNFDSPIRLRGPSIDLSGLYGALHDNKRTSILFLGNENSLRS